MKKLSKAGQAHLKKITGGGDLKQLNPVDADTLNRYAESYARWEQLEAGVERYGLLVKQQNGFPAENPYIPISHRYSAACSRMESAVKKILSDLRRPGKAPAGGTAPGEDDDLDGMFGRDGLGEIDQEP